MIRKRNFEKKHFYITTIITIKLRDRDINHMKNKYVKPKSIFTLSYKLHQILYFEL